MERRCRTYIDYNLSDTQWILLVFLLYFFLFRHDKNNKTYSSLHNDAFLNVCIDQFSCLYLNISRKILQEKILSLIEEMISYTRNKQEKIRKYDEYSCVLCITEKTKIES